MRWLILLWTAGCAGGGDLSVENAAIKPTPFCSARQSYCDGDEIHLCKPGGKPGPLLYDCTQAANEMPDNPITCRPSPGYENVDFVDFADITPPGPAGCGHVFPVCKIALDPPEFDQETFGTDRALPNCGFEYLNDPLGPVFEAHMQGVPADGTEDALEIQVPVVGVAVGQTIPVTADWPIETGARLNGKLCIPAATYGPEVRSLSGTLTLDRWLPDWQVTVDLTCITDPTIHVQGTFSGLR